MGHKSLAGGGGFMGTHVHICHYGFRSSCSKRRCALGFIMSSLCEAFVSWLRVGVVEQASGSIMAGTSVFSVHLPLTQLWPSTAFRSSSTFR